MRKRLRRSRPQRYHHPPNSLLSTYEVWDMNRKVILDCLNTAGHADLVADLDPLIRPAIHISARQICHAPVDFQSNKEEHNADRKKFAEAMQQLALGASRFGGLPDLPPNVEWPRRDGVPMEFVAQIRLEDIAPHDSENALPHAGTLLFFYNSQWTTYDQDEDFDACRVIHFEGPDSALLRADPPTIQWRAEYDDKDRPTPFIHGLARLTFSRFEMPPGGVSPFISRESRLYQIWQDFHCEYSATWSAVPNGKTYVENHLLGYVDAQDYVGAHKHGTHDRALLQVDSDDAADFQWGDCDRLYFILTDEQLAARDFSKVRLYSLLG